MGLIETDKTQGLTFNQMLVTWLITSVTFMELLDTSILNTSIPQMALSLNTNVLDLKLAVTAYLISLAIFIPISGWIAEVLGTRNTIISAVLIFTLSSAFCGMSSSLSQLVVFRIMQGVGEAMMTPVSRLILVRLFEGDNLARAAGLATIPKEVFVIKAFHYCFIIMGFICFVMALVNLSYKQKKGQPPVNIETPFEL